MASRFQRDVETSLNKTMANFIRRYPERTKAEVVSYTNLQWQNLDFLKRIAPRLDRALALNGLKADDRNSVVKGPSRFFRTLRRARGEEAAFTSDALTVKNNMIDRSSLPAGALGAVLDDLINFTRTEGRAVLAIDHTQECNEKYDNIISSGRAV